MINQIKYLFTKNISVFCPIIFFYFLLFLYLPAELAYNAYQIGLIILLSCIVISFILKKFFGLLNVQYNSIYCNVLVSFIAAYNVQSLLPIFFTVALCEGWKISDFFKTGGSPSSSSSDGGVSIGQQTTTGGTNSTHVGHIYNYNCEANNGHVVVPAGASDLTKSDEWLAVATAVSTGLGTILVPSGIKVGVAVTGAILIFLGINASSAKNTVKDGLSNPNPLMSQDQLEAALRTQQTVDMSHSFAAKGSSSAYSVKESFVSFHQTFFEKLNSLIHVGSPVGDLLQCCKYAIILAIVLIFVVILNLLFRELLLKYLDKKLSNEKLGSFGVYARKYLNLFAKLS